MKCFSVLLLFYSLLSGLECESDIHSDECEEGWYMFGPKCFRYHNDMAGANFHDAMSICQYIYRASMASIHSQQESDFLTDMVFNIHHAKYSVWIGLVRASNDSFVWIDKSSLNYTNWGPNEPNNYLSKNYCSVMSSASSARGKWFDVGCTTTYLVMCQKYLTQTTNTLSPNISNDYNSEIDLSIEDQINMHLEDKESDDKSDFINELNSVRIKGNVNLVLISILFIVIIVCVIEYKFKLVFNRRIERNSDLTSFGNSL